MLRTFGVILTAVTVALTGVAGPAGAVGASPAPTPTPVCPPVVPISGQVTAATTTSLTIFYSIMLRPPCGYDPPMTVLLFGSRADAELGQHPVASAATGLERFGSVTIDGLTPDTKYWFRFTDAAGTLDRYIVGGPARTVAESGCGASATTDASWPRGFVATVTVRNTGEQPLDDWRVTWRWSDGQQMQTLWNGSAEAAGADVTVRNASYNATLAPSASTTFGFLATGVTPAGIAVTCGR